MHNINLIISTFCVC